VSEDGEKKPANYQSIVSQGGNATGSILSSALNVLVGQKLDQLRTAITASLGQGTVLASLFTDEKVSAVPDQIENHLRIQYEYSLDALKAGIGLGCGGLFTSLFENLTGTNNLLASYNGLIESIAIDPHIERWLKSTYRTTLPNVRTAFLMSRAGLIESKVYDRIYSFSGYDNSYKTPLETLWTPQPSTSELNTFYRRGLVSEADLKQRQKIKGFDDVAISAFFALTREIPDANSLRSFRAKGLLSDEIYKNNMKTHGFDSAVSDTFLLDSYRYPDAQTALALFRRTLLNTDQFRTALKRNGLPDEYISAIEASRDVIPPIQDLIRFAVREAFLDHSGDKQYAEFERLAGLQGLTPERSAWYWYAHWERIPLNRAYSNLHRGLWTKEQFMAMLRIQDVHPDDRDAIYNVAFNPPSIRELGYGFDVGAYTVGDIVAARRAAGLTEADAQKAANALIEYRTNAVRNGVRTELMHLFARGKITETQYLAELRTVRTQEAAIPLWLQRGKLEGQRLNQSQLESEGKIVSSSEAIKAFKNTLITESDLRAKLSALEWTPERIDLAVRQAKHEMAPTVEGEKPKEFKALSESTVRTAREIGLLSDSQALERLTALGYDPKDASLLIDVQQFEILRSEIDKLLTEADNDFTNGWISEDTLRADYGATPYGSDVVDLLIERAKERRDRNMKEDLKTALLDRFKKGDLSETEVTTELSRLGLVQDWISSEVARAKATMLTKVKNEPTSTLKTLSEAQYSRSFKYGLIDESSYRQKLELFKYGEDDIDLLVSLNQPEKPPEPTLPDLSLGELKSAYRNEILTEQAFRAELTKRGYDDEETRVIVATEKVKLEAAIAKKVKAPDKVPVEKIPTLTLGELKSAFRKQILSSTDLRTELGTRLYAPELQEILIYSELAGQKEEDLRTAYRRDIITKTELVFELQRREYSDTDIKNILADEEIKKHELTRTA